MLTDCPRLSLNLNLNLNLITNIDLASIALQEHRKTTQNRRVALKGIDTKVMKSKSRKICLVVVGCCDCWHQVVTKYLVLRAILSRLIGHKGTT